MGSSVVGLGLGQGGVGKPFELRATERHTHLQSVSPKAAGNKTLTRPPEVKRTF